jgi:hypothetical protein
MAKWQEPEAKQNLRSGEACENLEPRKKDLKELLLGGPKFDNFEIERESDHGREIDLSDLEEQ